MAPETDPGLQKSKSTSSIASALKKSPTMDNESPMKFKIQQNIPSETDSGEAKFNVTPQMNSFGAPAPVV
jgi:hypothetical protein